MKKTILILVLVLSSILSISQTVIPTYKNAVGYWNESTKQYDFEDYVYAKITFTFYDTYITVTDQGNSVYRIIKDLPKFENDNVIVNSAQCLDETNKECQVGIMQVKGNDEQTNIGVIYNGKMFMYILDLDKLKELKNHNSKELKGLN
jgi:uncharacterized protein YprB with RNaseH-like and TPR domain